MHDVNAVTQSFASPLSPVDILLLAIGVFSCFVLLGIWRRRPAPPPRGAFAPPVHANPREIVALACHRCSRVVDVPRDRLVNALFCPRCGSRMPDMR